MNKKGKKPKRGNVYRCRDSRRSYISIVVTHVRRKLGVAEIVDDLGQERTIQLHRLTPKHHWGFAGNLLHGERPILSPLVGETFAKALGL